MDHLAKKIAEMALRLTTLPAHQYKDPQILDSIEQFARELLKDVSAARLGDSYAAGETSGRWRVVARPPQPH